MRYLLFLLITFQMTAQQGRLIYKNEASLRPFFQKIKDNDSVEYKRYKDFAENYLKIDNEVQQELIYKKNEAIFKPISNEDDGYLLSLYKSNQGIFYKNIKKNLNYQYKTKHLKTFKITNTPVIWKKTKFFNTILGYRCYKALGTFDNPQTLDEEYTIEAWFTSKIPVPFGPKGYGDLPGLILELNVANNHYIAIDIDEFADIQIDEPTNGEKISKKEYQQFLDEKFNSLPKF